MAQAPRQPVVSAKVEKLVKPPRRPGAKNFWATSLGKAQVAMRKQPIALMMMSAVGAS